MGSQGWFRESYRHYLASKGIRTVQKKGKVHTTRSGVDVRRIAVRVRKQISPYVRRAEIAGSIRRGVSDPVDIDIVAVPKSEQSKMQIKDTLRKKAKMIYADGDRKFSADISGVKTEVVFAQPDEFGAALLTYTGPYGANISKRRIAKQKGYLLNEKGLFKNQHRIASSEREIYQKLGYTYRSPEERGKPRE